MSGGVGRRACRGVIFRTLETVRYYISKTETTTGLSVSVRVLDTRRKRLTARVLAGWSVEFRVSLEAVETRCPVAAYQF